MIFYNNDDVECPESMRCGRFHFELFDASQNGDLDEFKKYVDTATTNDLEWALEVCRNVEIAKIIIEERNITGFIHCCLKTAIAENNTKLKDYIESNLFRLDSNDTDS